MFHITYKYACTLSILNIYILPRLRFYYYSRLPFGIAAMYFCLRVQSDFSALAVNSHTYACFRLLATFFRFAFSILIDIFQK